MAQLANSAKHQDFTTIPESQPVGQVGIESRRIASALGELGGSLDEQADQLDKWREQVIQLLLTPLVDEENEETTGQEYQESTELQDEIMVLLQVLRAAVADRQATVTAQLNNLALHEARTALSMARAGDGPFPEMLIKLFSIRDKIKPPFFSGGSYTSLKGLIYELRSLTATLRQQLSTGSSRASNELALANNLLKSILSQQTEQAKAVESMEKELERFNDTLNAR